MEDPRGGMRESFRALGSWGGALWSQGLPEGSQGALAEPLGGPRGATWAPKVPRGGHLAPQGDGKMIPAVLTFAQSPRPWPPKLLDHDLSVLIY